jgi:cytochrome c-type biogenesis protein CcmE
MSSPPQDPQVQAPAHASGGLSKGVQLAIGALVVAGLLGWYGYTNLGEGSSFTYYQTLEEFVAADVPAGNRALRVHGYVANASIERDLEGRQVRFVVQNDPPHAAPDAAGARLAVVYRSLETPDLFKDGAEVVVEGRLQGASDGTVFVADNVMAKCPSKFQAEAGGEGPGSGTQAL